MWREVNEEVRIVDYITRNYCGTIYDPSTEVGRVHLGVLQVIELLDGYIAPKDPSIVDAGLVSFDTLLSSVVDLEPWSQMVVNGLFAILNGTKAPSP
jgi:predicted NUDIX family phosphoesterase